MLEGHFKDSVLINPFMAKKAMLTFRSGSSLKALDFVGKWTL